MPDRPLSRSFLAVVMPHMPPPQIVVALCCRPSSCAFSCRCRSPSHATYHLGRDRPSGCGPVDALFSHVVATQRVPPYCALPRYPCSWPYLPATLVGRQVVEHCGGTGMLVPSACHEHVVNMGRYGHTRVSDLVTQTS
jgi:hypothetical protein